MFFIRFVLLVCCAAMFSPASAQTQAYPSQAYPSQAYPSKVIRIIVPFPAGQATDILARVLADQLSKSLGQAVIVENKPGAGGTLGADAGAKSAPDGHTLVMITIATHGIAPGLYPRLAYQPLRDFMPIANIGLTPQTLMVNKSSDIRSVSDLITKARSTELYFGSSGIGSASHLAAEMLKTGAGIKLSHVPYKGNSDAYVALMRGDIALLFDAVPGALPQITAGEVRGIGVAALQRSPYLPDLPTLAEQGLPGVEAVGWIGLAAPAKTPEAILDRLNAEVRRMLDLPDVKDRLRTLAFVPVGDSREQFTAFVRSEISKWSKVVKDANVKID